MTLVYQRALADELPVLEIEYLLGGGGGGGWGCGEGAVCWQLEATRSY